MSLYFDIISGRRKGLFAAVVRAGLFLMSILYRPLAAARNWFYDGLANTAWLERPCISVGNITTGGTGKTPLIAWLAKELASQGKKVAILSRGYKGDAGGNDELKMTSQACPQAICIANPDRVSAGRYAIQEHGADVILLDDAFQHRRIGRDLDIVLLDASCPLGYGHVLPRGLLRESAGGLQRATLLIITHVSKTTPQQLAELKKRCRELNPDAEILGCEHRPTMLADEQGRTEEISQLSGATVVAFAGIGNPDGFVQTLSQLGAKPIRTIRYPDHHRYTVSDCREISHTAQLVGAEFLVTTEKDMVKLTRLSFDWPVPLRCLRIKIDFVAQGGKMLLALVNDLFDEEPQDNGSLPLPAD